MHINICWFPCFADAILGGRNGYKLLVNANLFYNYVALYLGIIALHCLLYQSEFEMAQLLPLDLLSALYNVLHQEKNLNYTAGS